MRNARSMVKRIRAGRVVIVPNKKVNKVINLFEEREAIQVTDSDLPDYSYIMLKEADQKLDLYDELSAVMLEEDFNKIKDPCIHCNGKGYNGLDTCTGCNGKGF